MIPAEYLEKVNEIKASLEFLLNMCFLIGGVGIGIIIGVWLEKK